MDTTNNKTQQTVTIGGDWDAQAIELKTQYNQLTDEDLKFEEGKENDLITRLQSRLKKNREDVIKIIQAGQIEKK